MSSMAHGLDESVTCGRDIRKSARDSHYSTIRATLGACLLPHLDCVLGYKPPASMPIRAQNIIV